MSSFGRPFYSISTENGQMGEELLSTAAGASTGLKKDINKGDLGDSAEQSNNGV